MGRGKKAGKEEEEEEVEVEEGEEEEREREKKREGSSGRSSDRFAGSQPTDRRATCCWCCTEPRPPASPGIKAARGNTT